MQLVPVEFEGDVTVRPVFLLFFLEYEDWSRPRPNSRARRSGHSGASTCRSPPDINLNLILDNYGPHKHEGVRTWLAAHPRFQLHFTPTSASWLNLVESRFSKLTQQRLRRGVFCSVEELIAAIKDYLQHHNTDPKPFVVTTTVGTILRHVRKCKAIPGTHH